MKMPSVKSLLATFRDLTSYNARLVRDIGHAVDDAEQLRHLIDTSALPRTLRYVNSLHGNPYTSQMWRVTVAMYAMDEVCDTHGVEGLGGGSNQPTFSYLNVGDPYVNTLIYDSREHTCTVGDWGSIAENLDASEEV